MKHFHSLVIIGISTILFTSCSTEKEASIAIPEKEQTQIESGSISQSSPYLGYVESIESSNIGAKTAGRIVLLNVGKGDRVKAGQVLAKIDGEEAKETSSNASNAIQSTSSVYASTSELFDAQIVSTKEKIAQAEANIKLAEANLQGTSVGLGDTQAASDEGLKTVQKQLEQSEISLDTAKTQYENTKLLLNQKEKDIYLNAQNTLQSSRILAENVFDFTDTLFGITDSKKHGNDSFELLLCAKNTSLKTKSEELWKKNNTVYSSLKTEIEWLSSVDTSTEAGKAKVLSTLKAGQSFFESLRDLTDATYSCLDSSVEGTNFTATTINTYKTQITTLRTNVENILLSVSGNYIVGIRGSIQNIGNIENERSLQLSLLEKQITLAEKANEVAKQNYSQYQASTTGKINEVATKENIAKSQLEIVKKQYDEARAGLAALEKQKDAQLASISAQITNIKGNKSLADIAVDGTVVVAPFDGVITDKFASVGQLVGNGLPIFSVARDEKVKIKILVGESDAKRLQANDAATVYFSNHTYTGIISQIQPFADVLSKKIAVEIQLDNTNHEMILGSYADVSFHLDALSGKTAPYRFIEYSYGKSVVNVVKWDGIKKEEVKILGCDDKNCVLEGELSIGDNILAP